jgi:CubicO group peptidase (beta-lactamase class C family)
MPALSTSRLATFALLAIGGLLRFASPAQAEGLETRITQVAENCVSSGETPGILIGIAKAGQPPVFIARGVSDLATNAPMNPANCQRIGSVTKSFTVTRVLQLADEGRLSLDDPIEKYLPGLRNGSATLRELADMTSGIFNYTEDLDFVLPFAFHRTMTTTDRKIVAVANEHQPYFAPGARWYYSNTNTILLGMVVEQITGRPLRVEITRSLLRPLGLRRTFYPTGVNLPPPFSHGYTVLDTDQGQIDVTQLSPTFFSGAGAMISTPADLLRWGRALAQGSLISRRAQRERLFMINSSKGVGPYYDRYGLGLGRISGWLGHTGDLFGFQSLVMHNLVANETVVILVNSSGGAHLPTEIFQRLVGMLPSAQPARPTALRVIGKRVRTTSQTTVTLRGRASSEAGILLVESSTNGSPARPARGGTIWRQRVDLQTGRNVITLRATDRLGRKSSPARIVITRF